MAAEVASSLLSVMRKKIRNDKNACICVLCTVCFSKNYPVICCLSEASYDHNLDDLIESLGANNTSSTTEKQSSAETPTSAEKVYEKFSEATDDTETKGEEMKELRPEEPDEKAAVETKDAGEEEEEEGLELPELLVLQKDAVQANIEDVGAEQPATSLRRRNRPE